MLDELGSVQKVGIGGLVQVTVRVEPAGKGCNPATGEQITIIVQPGQCRRARSTAGASDRRAASYTRARRRLAAGTQRVDLEKGELSWPPIP